MQAEELELEIAVFQLNQDGVAEEMDDDENISTANHWVLPSGDAGMHKADMLNRLHRRLPWLVGNPCI